MSQNPQEERKEKFGAQVVLTLSEGWTITGFREPREGDTWLYIFPQGGIQIFSTHPQQYRQQGIGGVLRGTRAAIYPERYIIVRKEPAKPEVTRKDYPITTGCIHYFPDALKAVARCSKIGNDQHNPGEPLHWAKHKSTDHLDCLGRHLAEAGTFDVDDGIMHDVKVAWRALANLQTLIDNGTEVFK